MRVAPNSPPISGNGCSGNASCQRISRMKQKPSRRNTIAVMPYWMPITLWSTEKMYLRMKLSGGPWP